ncbi:acyltransferase family protein [Luteococcus sp. H138]|uniref:acyltransferase family protein n=1 Tax=unclassified Luteococcus TaxID=2639923 RepID=UPI00313A8D94
MSQQSELKPQPIASPSKRLDVQGLRAFAVGAVVADHAHLGLPGGFVGVDVFFVISGFVIGRSLLKELRLTNRLDLKKFYIRRVLRLLPAVSLVTVATALLTSLLASPLGVQQKAALTGAAATAWSSNIVLYYIAGDYFSENVQTNPFLHTWSLGVEEQFYLLFPLILVISWKIRRRATVLVTVGVLTAITFALCVAMSHGVIFPGIPRTDLFAFYMMPTRFWEFGIGFFVAAFGTMRKLDAAWAPQILGFFGVTGLLFGAYSIQPTEPFPGYVALIPTLSTALLIIAGNFKNLASEALSTRPLVYLGDISYSLYLWHWPILVFARRLAGDGILTNLTAVALSILCAQISYSFIENRFRKPAHERVLTALKPAFIGFILALTACTLLGIGSAFRWGIPSLDRQANELVQRPIGYKDCLSNVPVGQRDLSDCTWGSERIGRPIYLMGDSNAQQYTEALIVASEELGRPLTIITSGGCPMISLRLVYVGNTTQDALCREYVETALEWLGDQQSGDVVFAGASEQVTNPKIALRDEAGAAAATEHAKSIVWSAALRDTIAQLREKKHNPVLVETSPHFTGINREWWHPVDCQNWTLLSSPGECSTGDSVTGIERRMAHIFDAERKVVKDSSIHYIRVIPTLCPQESCQAYRDGHWWYRDGLHITTYASKSLGPLFTAELR